MTMFLLELFVSFIPDWPILACVHYYLSIVALRNEPGGRELAIHYPIASCCLSVALAGSGTIISSVMLGQPVLNTVLNERGVLSGVVIWLGVHFSPNDVIHRLSYNMYIKILLNVLEELRRSRNIMAGVLAGAKVYPSSVLPLALSGMFKGTGRRWSIKLYQLFVSPQGADSRPFELLRLSFCTKASFIIALVYAVLLDIVSTSGLVFVGFCVLCVFKIVDIALNRDTDVLQTVQDHVWLYLTKINFTNNSNKMQEKKD